jgi:hypothetical protein
MPRKMAKYDQNMPDFVISYKTGFVYGIFLFSLQHNLVIQVRNFRKYTVPPLQRPVYVRCFGEIIPICSEYCMKHN